MAKLALGHHCEAADAGCVRAVLAELILTFLFVFAGVGSAMATGKLAGGADSVVCLTAVALAHTLVVAVMVSAGLHVSGDHINPAVTLGLAVTGRITLFRSALYIAAQLLGSALAFLTGGAPTPVHALAAGVGALQGVLMEVVLTFSLLFAVYATVVDPRRAVGGMGPLLVGLVVVANVLAGGPLLRRVHEPRALLRAGARGRGLGRPLGLLGRAADWRAARRAGLRRPVHGPAGRPRAASKGPRQRLLASNSILYVSPNKG
ncbi:aquaporin TIP4-4 [Panicum miliaceum]|uniref:Aquaporin TIP4-4 n=1 Tax=Panicum miliaceum TaxID=4540 RepID=A0A3L6SRE0_PANMI|nr:aquaporin TIP4-4 [Panicum miliaceum]